MAGVLRAFQPNPEIEKEDLLSNLHWLKQVIGLVFGLVMGVLKLQGFPIFLAYVAVYAGISVFYAWNVVRAESVEGWDIVSDAFGPGFFCFVLAWVMAFSFA